MIFICGRYFLQIRKKGWNESKIDFVRFIHSIHSQKERKCVSHDDDDVDDDPTEDDTEMIRLAEEARAKVDAVVKKFKVDIRNRFKEKQIEQANKIAEVEKEMKVMMMDLSLLKNEFNKITNRRHQTQAESCFVKFVLTPESTPLERNLSVTMENARMN